MLSSVTLVSQQDSGLPNCGSCFSSGFTRKKNKTPQAFGLVPLMGDRERGQSETSLILPLGTSICNFRATSQVLEVHQIFIVSRWQPGVKELLSISEEPFRNHDIGERERLKLLVQCPPFMLWARPHGLCTKFKGPLYQALLTFRDGTLAISPVVHLRFKLRNKRMMPLSVVAEEEKGRHGMSQQGLRSVSQLKTDTFFRMNSPPSHIHFHLGGYLEKIMYLLRHRTPPFLFPLRNLNCKSDESKESGSIMIQVEGAMEQTGLYCREKSAQRTHVLPQVSVLSLKLLGHKGIDRTLHLIRAQFHVGGILRGIFVQTPQFCQAGSISTQKWNFICVITLQMSEFCFTLAGTYVCMSVSIWLTH